MEHYNQAVTAAAQWLGGGIQQAQNIVGPGQAKTSEVALGGILSRITCLHETTGEFERIANAIDFAPPAPDHKNVDAISNSVAPSNLVQQLSLVELRLAELQGRLAETSIRLGRFILAFPAVGASV